MLNAKHAVKRKIMCTDRAGNTSWFEQDAEKARVDAALPAHPIIVTPRFPTVAPTAAAAP